MFWGIWWKAQGSSAPRFSSPAEGTLSRSIKGGTPALQEQALCMPGMEDLIPFLSRGSSTTIAFSLLLAPGSTLGCRGGHWIRQAASGDKAKGLHKDSQTFRKCSPTFRDNAKRRIHLLLPPDRTLNEELHPQCATKLHKTLFPKLFSSSCPSPTQPSQSSDMASSTQGLPYLLPSSLSGRPLSPTPRNFSGSFSLLTYPDRTCPQSHTTVNT